MGQLDSFSGAIEKLYRAAAEASYWDTALDALGELTGSAGSLVNLVARQEGDANQILMSGRMRDSYDDGVLAEYNSDVVHICPRVATAIEKPQLEFLCDYMIFSESEMDRDPAYEWYGRQGVRYFIGAPLVETEGFRCMWSLQRTASQGHVQEQDVDLFRLIRPHMARALAMADRLGTLNGSRQLTSTLIESLTFAVCAVGRGGRLLLSNAAADRLLARGDGVTCRGGFLEAYAPSQANDLSKLVQEVASLGGRRSTSMRISRKGGQPDYLVSVWPIRAQDEQLLAARAEALLIIHDPVARQSPPAELLTQLYALTPAEARLAVQLAHGHTLDSAACVLGIAASTARTQLKSIFAKLGVTRQQDLIRLLTCLSTTTPGE